MQRRRVLQLGGSFAALAAVAWFVRGCYGAFVNTEDQPAADSIVAALDKYKSAKGTYPQNLDALVPDYLQALPALRRFGKLGYARLDDGRGCLVGYFTHRDFLEEYDCGAKAWSSVEYEESRLVKASKVQWLIGPT